MGRFRAALRTNEIQVVSVALFTALNLVACAQGVNQRNPWVWVFAAGFWGMVAFIGNLIDPMPKNQP